MKKIIVYPKGTNKSKRTAYDKSKERVTIQLRAYGKNGAYDKREDSKANATIHIKGMSVSQVNEILKSLVLNSRHIDDYFKVEE